MTQRAPSPAPSIIAAILTGGRGRRFGGDKASAPVLGVPSLVRVQAAVAAAGLPALTVGGPGADVADLAPGQGPLQALIAALTAARGRDVLLLGVDMPGLASHALRELCDAHRGDAVTVTVRGGQLEPLASIYPSALLPSLERAWRDGARGLRRLLLEAGWTIRRWETDEPGFDDFDTPEALSLLEGRLASARRGEEP